MSAVLSDKRVSGPPGDGDTSLATIGIRLSRDIGHNAETWPDPVDQRLNLYRKRHASIGGHSDMPATIPITVRSFAEGPQYNRDR